MNKKSESYSHTYERPFNTKPLWVRIAYLNVKQTPWPAWISYGLQLISYLELLGLMFLMHFSCYPNQKDFIREIVMVFVKIFDPVEALDLTSNSTLAIISFIIAQIYTILLTILCFANFYIAIKKIKADETKCETVASFIQIHSMIAVYPITSFSIKVFFQENLNIFGNSIADGYALGAAIWIFIINIWFAILGGAVTYNIIPTKEVSASINKIEPFTVIFQKIVIKFLYEAFPMGTGLKWTLAILNFCISTFRNGFYKWTLPVYNFHFLKFTSQLCTTTFLLSCTILINLIWKESDEVVSPYLGFIGWILPLPLCLKYDNVRVTNLIVSLITSEYNPNKSWTMTHRVGLLQYITKNRKDPHSQTRIIDEDYFYYITVVNNLESVFGTSSQALKCCAGKGFHNKVILSFLEKATKKCSCYYVKLFLAYWYIKKIKHYARGIILLHQIDQESAPVPVKIGILYLQNVIFEAINKEDSEQKFILSLYFDNLNLENKLRNLMKNQTACQLQFWKEYNDHNPNVVKLKKIEKKITMIRSQIQRIWNRQHSEFHPSFRTPYLLYGAYMAALNNNPVEGERFLTLAINSFKKFQYLDSSDELTSNNAYSDNTTVITISGNLRNLGLILDCTSSISQYGYDHTTLIGSELSTIMTPFYRDSHSNAVLKFLQTGKAHIVGQHTHNFLQKKNGTVVYVSQQTRIDPSIADGLKFTALIRPMKTNKHYILILENNRVESYTEEIGEMLGLRFGMSQHLYPQTCPL